MPQTTNLNTSPYFEDFDPNDNFNKVLFKPGVPLQARELTVLQSILQDQIEKLGSSIYREGAMVIPGQPSFDLQYTSVAIEDEYFGIPSSLLVDFIVGQTIVGQTSNVKAKVVNAITAEQSERNYTTLFIKYISGGNNVTSSTFLDDEILIANNSFSIGSTVIQENTDFAKCISVNATGIGSSAKITPGIYFIKGFFVTVAEQEIILDQFNTTPSYRIGLEVIENIVTSEDDERLNDPSQGFSNFAAPGADRLKLETKLIKKRLDDTTSSDFIELIRLKNGEIVEIIIDEKAQLSRTLEDTLARRTYDESGNYEVKPYKFSKDECLNDGTNNGIFRFGELTNQGRTPSKDLFEINISPGKAYVLGYEISNLATTYVDVEKARTTTIEKDVFTNLDGRGYEFNIGTTIPTYTNLTSAYTNKVVVLEDGGVVVGYAIFVGYENKNDQTSNGIIRVAGIKFINETKRISDVDAIVINPATLDYESNSRTGGQSLAVTSTSGSSKPYFFRAWSETVLKSLEGLSVYNVLGFAESSVVNGEFTVNAPFTSTNPTDYTVITNLNANVSISTVTPNVSAGTATFVLSDNTVNNCVVFGPQSYGTPSLKLSSLKKMRVLKLQSIGTDNSKYDINSTELSLGATRVTNIRGIFAASSSAPKEEVIPNFDITISTGNFIAGEIIEGSVSGAKGRFIEIVGGKLYFVYETDANFIANETVTGYLSNSTGIINVTSNPIFNGLVNIKQRYTLEDGQTTQTFEYSSLRKTNTSSSIASTDVLWVIVDHLEDTPASANTGLYYTVDSYIDCDIEEVPSFFYGSNANSDEYYITDTIDFRINQSNLFTTSSTGSVSSPYTLDSTKLTDFVDVNNFANQNYILNQFKLPAGYAKIDKLEYYLARFDQLYLDQNGEFILKKGAPSIQAKAPAETVKNAMKVMEISIPPYTRNLNDVGFSRVNNKRYTMRDIGRLEERLESVEYYTQLSLLETDTSNLFISDANGLNRLKNGFIVDNFTSHDIGDTTHPAYKCSIDSAEGHLRPRHYTTNVSLRYEETPTNYLTKGGQILLNYDHEELIDQPFASGVENINPFAVVSWVGTLVASPAVDDWVEENRLPDNLTEIEGDYNAMVQALNVDETTGFAPTEWGAWQTQWSSRRLTGGWWWSNWWWWWGWGWWGRWWWRREEVTSFQTRTGVRTRVTPRVDRTVLGDRVVDTKYAHWKRSRNVKITATLLKPGVEVFPFLDGRSISAYTTPKLVKVSMQGSSPFQVGEEVIVTGNVDTTGRRFRALVADPKDYPDRILEIDPYTNEDLPDNYTASTTILNLNIDSMNELGTSTFGGYLIPGDRLFGETSGAQAIVDEKRLIADDTGAFIASFFIPDPNIDGNPRWKVGESMVRVTDSAENSQIDGVVDSSAETTYSASGTILDKQTDVLLQRNAEVVRDTVTDSRTIRTTRIVQRRRFWRDPLAQSFLVEPEGGAFISKIDIWFQTRDQELPVTMEIREMVNGYPGQTILGEITLTPDKVNVSDDASVATTFEFDSPVYVKDFQEYCFVLLSSSIDYKVWISEMGKVDLDGNRISSQPYAGVLFKSQNASTWTANQLQDLKFKIYRAEFDISETPVIKYVNANEKGVQSDRLRTDPINLSALNGTNYIKIIHPNHGMHDPASSVRITGVSTEQWADLYSDFAGSGSITLKGNKTTFESLDNIKGVAVSQSNPAYLRIGACIYTFDPNTGVSVNGANNEYTITLLDKVAGIVPTGGFRSDDDWKVEYYVIDGVPLTEINKIHSNLRWITFDAYHILVDVTRNSSSNITFGGQNVFATKNVMYNQVHPQVGVIELPGTNVEAEYKATSGTSLGTSKYSDPTSSETLTELSYVRDSEFIPVTLNEDNWFPVSKLIASSINETNQMQNNKSANLYLKLSSTKSNLSPVIDTERVSLITTSSRIADFDGDVSKKFFVNPIPATATLSLTNVSAGALTGTAQITNIGSGYSAANPPTITIVPDPAEPVTPTGGTATPIILDGKIAKITVSGGSDYTLAPTLSIPTPAENYVDIGSEPLQDFNPASYVTKLVTLANACTGLRIEFAAFNPGVSPTGSDNEVGFQSNIIARTDIDVYVKTFSGEESVPLLTEWTELPNNQTRSESRFIDYKYNFDITEDGAKPNASFTQFQIKIRLRGRNQAIVPLIKDLRCIALA